jgi:hypothetical protein
MINFMAGKEWRTCEQQDTRTRTTVVSTRDLNFRAGLPDHEHQIRSHFGRSDVASQSAA